MPASTRPLSLALLIALLVLPLGAADEVGEGSIAAPAGEPIDFSHYLVPGKTVIFGFGSRFSPPCPCAPCEELGDPLGALAASRDDVVIVWVDIDRMGKTRIDWNSPVSLQLGLRRLPHFKVYGPEGEVLAEDDQRSSAAIGRDFVHAMIEGLPGHRS